MSIREEIGEVLEKELSESTTGCRENPRGLGQYCRDPDGEVLTKEQAYDVLREGEGTISLPNAGAGSFRQFFTDLGFDDVKVLEWSSSAGNWTFGVHDGPDGDWYVAGQTNRYPYRGFTYWVNLDYGGFESFEQLCEMMANL